MTVKYTDGELLDELTRLADELGHTPTNRDMVEYGAYTHSTYRNRFGSWNDALREVGLEPNKRHGIPDRELLAGLSRLADELDRTPTYSDMKEHGEYGYGIYGERFGSWNDALREVGLEPNEQKIPDGELLDELRRLAGELGNTPGARDMTEHGAYSHGAYERRFGSWNNALQEVGLETTPAGFGRGENHPDWKGGGSD